MGPMYATVDMQSTAEEKQQAAPRISHYGTFVRGTCMAERDFHVVLNEVFRLVGVWLFCCVNAINVWIESWSSVDRPLFYSLFELKSEPVECGTSLAYRSIG